MDTTARYNVIVDKKWCHLEFEVGDFVWAILTKDRFSIKEYNKLAIRKVGPLEVIEKINANVYRLKLPSHICTFDVFNVRHLILYRRDSSSDRDVNSRENSLQSGENDVV